MREVKATFVQLLELLAESMLLYGAEVWGVEDSLSRWKCADVGS